MSVTFSLPSTSCRKNEARFDSVVSKHGYANVFISSLSRESTTAGVCLGRLPISHLLLGSIAVEDTNFRTTMTSLNSSAEDASFGAHTILITT